MKKKLYLCIICLFVAGSSSIFAHEPNYKYLWGNIGLGIIGIPGDNLRRVDANLELTKQVGYHNFSVRLISFSMPFNEEAFDNGQEIGLLYGRALTPPSSSVQISGGIGIALTRMQVDWDMVTAIGIPVEAKLVVRLSRKFGIGLYHFWNINASQTYFGTNVNIFFGINMNK